MNAPPPSYPPLNPQPPHQPPGAAPGVNVKALWALPLAVGCAVLGVVLAHLARDEIRRTGERGAGMAKAALVIGYPMLGLWFTCWMSLLLAIMVGE